MGMIETKTANAIRVLSADAIQKAKSGHPGLPLGCASAAYELWANHMRHNPAAFNPFCQTIAGELKKTSLPLCTMARIMIFYSGEETSAATGLKKNIIHALHRS